MALAALVMALALGAAGCGRRERATPVHRDLIAGAPSGDAAVAPPLQVLEWIERDAELVIGVNFEQLRRSALGRAELLPWLAAQLPTALPAMRQRCGLDPLARLRDVTLGVRNFVTTPEGSLVIRGLPGDALWRCLREVRAELRRDGFDPMWDGEVLSLRTPQGNGAVLVREDDDVVRGLLGVEVSSLDLQRSAKRPAPLRSSLGFRRRYERLDGTASAWFLLQGPLLGYALEEQADLEAISGVLMASTAAATDAADAAPVRFDLRIHTSTPERGARYAATAERRLGPAVATELSSFSIAAEGQDVRLRATLTLDQLRDLAARLDSPAAVLTGPRR